MTRRLEAEGALDALEHRDVGFLGDADGAVALHVGVAAQRADAGARLAVIALQQQQVRDLLDIVGATHVLGDAHAVGDDGGVGLRIGGGDLAELGAAEAGDGFDRRPRRRAQIGGERFEPIGMLGDEGVVEHVMARVIHLDQRLHDALQHRGVGADLGLIVGRGDPGRAEGGHLDWVLRIGEAFQRALAQRVEHDDRHAAARHLPQRAHHAWMIGARIVAHRDDQLAMVEILERHRALADADRLRQADAGRLVTHVRAVGEIVAAVFAREDLEQEGSLVRGAAGGVELRHVGIGQRAQRLANPREGVIPCDRLVGVGCRVIGERFGQSALVLQMEVAPAEQFGDGMGGKEFRRDAFAGRLPGDGLGTVLAELEGGGVLLVGPGAARAIEAIRLVGAQQRDRRLDQFHLGANRIRGGFEGAPAAGRSVIGADTGNVALLDHMSSCCF